MNGFGDILFFDVGVERIVHLPDVIQADGIRHARQIGLAINHIGLEAVEAFQGQYDSRVPGVFAGGAQAFYAPMPFMVIISAADQAPSWSVREPRSVKPACII